MLYKSVDGTRIPLTSEEIEEFNKRESDHNVLVLEKERNQYLQHRLEALSKEKINDNSMILALWDRIMNSDPSASDFIQKKILEINEIYPSPK